MTAQALRSIYQFKVSLKGIRPPVWRRFQVDSTDTLADLHLALQIIMGWFDEHLYEFTINDENYGMPDDDFPNGMLDAADYRLDQLLGHEKEKIYYMYDFGDGWEHEVVLEKILPFTTESTLPVCLKGSRACPPEDIGGVPGYKMFLGALQKPDDPDNADMLEWFGDEIDYDPELFDLDKVNSLLDEYYRVGNAVPESAVIDAIGSMVERITIVEQTSYLVECLAVDHTGEAKSEFGNAINLLQQATFLPEEEKTDLLDKLLNAHENLNKGESKRAASHLSFVCRTLWQGIMEQLPGNELL